MILRRQFGFEAAHSIENHPGRCRNPHGHSYRLFVSVEGPVDPVTGMIMDFSELAGIVQEKVLDRMDHSVLNHLVPLATSENLAAWIWEQLRPGLPGLAQVELFETSGSCVIHRGR